MTPRQIDEEVILEQTASQLEYLRSRKTKLLHKIAEVEQELGVTEAKHARLLNRRAAISKLPQEVLATIFQLCQENWLGLNPKTRGKPFEVVASHVSWHWREVAVGTPLLWNAIHQRVSNSEGAEKQALQRQKVYLARSDTCPLDVTLETHDILLLQALVAHAYRWYRVSVEITCASVEDVQTLLSPLATPILVHLSIGIKNISHASPRTEFPKVCCPVLTSGAPLLSFVRVSGMAVGHIEPPLSAVTTLYVDAHPSNLMSYSQFRTMLASVPRLVNLSVSGLNIHFPRDPFADSTPIPMPTLQSLRIAGNATPCYRLLSFMTLHHLGSLALLGIDKFDSAMLPTVRKLSLHSCNLTEDEIGTICRAYPGITELSVDDSLPQIFTILSPEADTLWPNLEILNVMEMQPSDTASFCLMAMRRLGGDGKLRRIRLDRRSRSVLKIKDYLTKLRELVLVENCGGVEEWPLYLAYDYEDMMPWY